MEFKEYIEKLPSLLENKKDIVIITADKTYILNGVEPSCNYEYCKKHNLEILNTEHIGGTIVNGKDDICVTFFTKVKPTNDDASNLAENLIAKLYEYINKHTSANINYENNDILLEGFKTISWSCAVYDDSLYAAIHIPFNIDLELIKNVCTKEMVKIPKGLEEFGINRNEIMKLIEEEVTNDRSKL